MTSHSDQRFTTLELIGSRDCPHPDLLTFGGALIHKNVCIAGNVIVDQDVVYGNTIIGQIGGVGFEWQLHARFDKFGGDEGGLDMSDDPRGTSLFQTAGFPNPAHHIFDGPLGDYAVTVLTDGDANIFNIGLLEISLSQLNTDPLPLGVSQIGTFVVPSLGGNYRHFVTTTVTANITPAVWYYYASNNAAPVQTYEVQVTQIV